MTTDHGRKFVASRLAEARNLNELAAVWATIAVPYQRDPHIFQLKESLKKKWSASHERHQSKINSCLKEN